MCCQLRCSRPSRRMRVFQSGVSSIREIAYSRCIPNQRWGFSWTVPSCTSHDFCYFNVFHISSPSTRLCNSGISISRRGIREERISDLGTNTYMGGTIFWGKTDCRIRQTSSFTEDLEGKHKEVRFSWRCDKGKATIRTILALQFSRWLYLNTLYSGFTVRWYDLTGKYSLIVAAVLPYCERFVELLIDLQSQLPTRKYTNALLLDLHILVAIHLSPMYMNTKNELFRDLVAQLEHYIYFSVNSYTSAPLSENEMHEIHCRELATLQRVAMQHFKEKLTVLALSNFASIDKRAELIELLSELTEDEMVQLCNYLHLRTSYPQGTKATVDRNFLLEVLVETYQKRESFVEQARKLNIYPNDVSPPITTLLTPRNHCSILESWNTKTSQTLAPDLFPSQN